jgi:predicted esterase
MTRQHRELAISDNLAWVSTCLDAAASEWPTIPAVLFTGFSQGVGMAFRAAVNSTHKVGGVIAVGGDIPPEIAPAALRRVSAALMVRGANDPLYTGEIFAEDQRRLRDSAVTVRTLEPAAGHEWPTEIATAASQFLTECYP